MGVKGLAKFLSERMDGAIEKIASPLMAIDGHGFMFYILESMHYEYTSFSYFSLHNSVQSHIDELQRIYGLQVTVFFDGSKRQMKMATTESRDIQIDEMWNNLLDMCTCGGSYLSQDLPIAELCVQQLISTLNLLKVDIIFCEAEADPVMSKWSVDNNAYCYAKDR